MAGGGAKKPSLPPVADPVPTPEQITIESMQKAEDVRRKLRARTGRAGTILTEAGTLGEPLLQKATLLGQAV